MKIELSDKEKILFKWVKRLFWLVVVVYVIAQIYFRAIYIGFGGAQVKAYSTYGLKTYSIPPECGEWQKVSDGGRVYGFYPLGVLRKYYIKNNLDQNRWLFEHYPEESMDIKVLDDKPQCFGYFLEAGRTAQWDKTVLKIYKKDRLLFKIIQYPGRDCIKCDWKLYGYRSEYDYIPYDKTRIQPEQE